PSEVQTSSRQARRHTAICGLASASSEEHRTGLERIIPMLDQLPSPFDSGPFIGLPRGYFRIGYIDPPWTFHAWSHRGEGKGACQHYSWQTLDDIIALPVDQLMAPDAAIFLWVVQPMYPEAMRVLTPGGSRIVPPPSYGSKCRSGGTNTSFHCVS